MTKLCARGKSAAKRKFKVYPSAYANAYASKICGGKIKDPSGTKKKDWGPKKMKVGGINTDSHMQEMKKGKVKINKVVKALKKASKLHAGQAKSLSTIKLVRGGGAAIRGLNFQGVR